MKKLLVTGASGFLGWNVCEIAKSNWILHGTYRSNPKLPSAVHPHPVDLTNFKDLEALFMKVKPDAVIHAAGIRDPEFCQENKSLSHKINAIASINIAGLSSDFKIPCMFVSSDLVFNGLNPPYREEDEPSPISIYGEHKAIAEKEMPLRCPETVICRLPLMYGNAGPAANSFLQPLIRAIKSKTDVDLFVDEFRTPISGRDAAVGLMLAVKHWPDIIHLGGPERISRYEFGKLLAEILRIDDAKIRPCNQSDIDLAAARPPDVSLDIKKARSLGFHPKSPKEELRQIAKAGFSR
jgi:dTDP-4-dehydrorhamnose reductase